LYPEERFHALIQEVAAEVSDDESIYKKLLTQLKSIKPFLRDLRFAVPALLREQREMTRQSIELLADQISINGYVEIGGNGRQINHLRSSIMLSGNIVLINDATPRRRLRDILMRGGLGKIGRCIPLNNFSPIAENALESSSVDLVTCFIGLHHAPSENIAAFIDSIHRILRPEGRFIVRDHDAETPEVARLASLIHTISNLDLGVPWEINQREIRNFHAVQYWTQLISDHGFVDHGQRLLQPKDTSENTLMIFSKCGG
jgi:SAM-dependent methyltransferase